MKKICYLCRQKTKTVTIWQRQQMTTNEQLKEKDAEIKRLRKALELEKLRSKAFSTMIDLAEETFNIPVRKKSGTKQ